MPFSGQTEVWKHPYLEGCLPAWDHRRSKGTTKTAQLLWGWVLIGGGRCWKKKRDLHPKIMKTCREVNHRGYFKYGKRKARPTQKDAADTQKRWGGVTQCTIPAQQMGGEFGKAQSGWRQCAKRQRQQRSSAGDLMVAQAKETSGERGCCICTRVCVRACVR